MHEPLDFFVQLMNRGGPVMWPIAICSLITVIITLRKLLQWTFLMLHIIAGAKTWTAVLNTLSSADTEATLVCMDEMDGRKYHQYFLFQRSALHTSR